MARIRKEPNRYWSKEEKLKMIKEVLNGKSTQEVARENDISGGMLRNWIKKYLELGEDSLENKKKPGNPLLKYSMRKELTEFESLENETEGDLEEAVKTIVGRFDELNTQKT